jgi:alkane 1-monooxygenase
MICCITTDRPAMPTIARYAVTTLPPLILITMGAVTWVGYGALALIWLTVLAAGLDHILMPPERADGDHAPWSDTLSVVLSVGHFTVLGAVLWAVAQPGMSVAGKIVLVLAAASAFGQISHPNAHELIHRRPRLLSALGAAVYTSVGFGHHVSAHRLVHHRHVGTLDDPNTPRAGESFWAYLPRAWAGSFAAGWTCEADRLARKGQTARTLANPYLLWVGGALAALLAAVAIGGGVSALTLLFLGFVTGAQVLMSDYLQHYGLSRLTLPSGRVEPVGPHHSWNAPRGFSSYLMMNAPAHSEHHMHPDTPYDRLDPGADVPTLPHAMPVMAMIALVPRAWHRVMDKRAAKVMAAAEARIAA